MIRKLFALCLFVLAACGGTPEDVNDDGGEIGQAEQPIFAPRTANYVLGATQTQPALRCTTTSSGQFCNVPTTRVFTYCADGLNAEEINDLGAVGAGASSNQHFSWTELRDPVFPFNPVRDAACQSALQNHQVNVLVNHIDNFCASAGATATNIDTLVCMNPTVVTAQLPEVPNVPGAFFGTNGGIIHIDRARLLSKFPNATDRARVRQHGLGHAATAIDGLGARTESTSTFLWTRRQVQPISTLGRTLSTGEDCTLRFYSATGGTNYTQDATSCINSSPE